MPVNLTSDAVARLTSRLQKIPAPPGDGTIGRRPDNPLWLKLTAEDPANPGQYKWTLQQSIAGVFSDVSPAITSGTVYSAWEINAETGIVTGTTGTTGTIVRATPAGEDTSGNALYFFAVASGDNTITGLVTGNATGSGKYVGKSYTDVTADVSATTDLSAADLGTPSSTVDCLILNPPELGSSTTGHDVTAAINIAQFSLYFTGRLAYINSDGTKVVHAQLFWAGCVDDGEGE